VTNLKSEYHGRIREKAEQYERTAERERQKAAEQSNIEKIVRSIEGVTEKLDRQSDEDTSHKKSERRWRRAEVIGLWAAAAVGVIAILVANSDSEHQRHEMHGQLDAMQGQLSEMRKAYAPLKDSADAAKTAANAALAANATTRSQINASLIIPDEPDSTIRIGPDGSIAIDLYVANIGQSWARDVYLNVEVTVRNGGKPIYRGPPAFGGEFDVSPQTPWHHTIADFKPKFPVTIVNSGDELDVAVTIAMSYSNIFDERIHRIFQLQASRGDMDGRCCTPKELENSVELQRYPDLSRLPAIPTK
jgi:hypothetical protein